MSQEIAEIMNEDLTEAMEALEQLRVNQEKQTQLTDMNHDLVLDNRQKVE